MQKNRQHISMDTSYRYTFQYMICSACLPAEDYHHRNWKSCVLGFIDTAGNSLVPRHSRFFIVAHRKRGEPGRRNHVRAIMNNERGCFLDMSGHELTADDVSTPCTHASALEALQPTYGLPRSTRETTLSLSSMPRRKERSC